MVEAKTVSQSLISGTVQAFFVYRVWRSKFLYDFAVQWVADNSIYSEPPKHFAHCVPRMCFHI